MKQLQSLEVFNCELTNNDDYRTKVFELLEDVLFVDGFDREGQPAPNDDDEDQDGKLRFVVSLMSKIVENEVMLYRMS